MVFISVKEWVGEAAMTPGDGEQIYSLIEPSLRDGGEVTLDFSGVRFFASPFFNNAIGRLLENHSPDDLNRLLHVQDLSAVGQAIFRRVVENAKRYYSSQAERAAQESAVLALADC